MKRSLLLVSLLLLANAQAGELYRSIDKDGNVHYSDRPLSGAEDVAAVKVDKERVPEESLPYETQRARQNFPVTLYSFPDCGPTCKEAKDFLTKRGIPFTDKSLVKQEDIDAFRKASGDSQVPALTIGKTWVKGFLAEQWNKELDYAGYPKSIIGYRPPRPATPAAQPAEQ